MEAAVHRRFGDPGTVRIEQVPRPRVGQDDVLTRAPGEALLPRTGSGRAATGTVQSLGVTPSWLRDDRDGGVFGVIGRVSIRNGCAAVPCWPGLVEPWSEATAVP